ncbi:MAG: STAS domain-containing protein [Gaiellales bacterium]|nr:STAS domain-containing protein [Gaiellales bacterium]
MELTISRLSNVPVLNIVGEIDHGNAPTVGATIDELIEQKQRTILLDLSQVDYMDSGGISVLLSALRRLREGGWLGVINPNANVRRLLQIVGLALDASFRVFDSVEDAQAAVQTHARP